MDPLDRMVPIVRLGTVDSTQLEARRWLEGPEAASTPRGGGRMFIAREQTAGRGRLGRAWQSPPGGLWTTVAWNSPMLQNREGRESGEWIERLGIRLGVACLHVVAEATRDPVAGPVVLLKWPNDILMNGRKVCGLLVEVVGKWVVVGVGMNVNNAAPEVIRMGGIPAASLRECCRREFDLDRLALDLREQIVHALRRDRLTPESLGFAKARIIGAPAGKLLDAAANAWTEPRAGNDSRETEGAPDPRSHVTFMGQGEGAESRLFGRST